MTDLFFVRYLNYKKEISAFFAPHQGERSRIHREKILTIAIELLIQNEVELAKLKQILSMNIHQGVPPHLYEAFIDTIIDCIAENDYLWQMYETHQERNPIKTAWENIKTSSLTIIQNLEQ